MKAKKERLVFWTIIIALSCIVAGLLATYNQPIYTNEIREFKSLIELRGFLHADKTDEHEYQEITFDCDDYAITLCKNATNSGYWMFTYAVFETKTVQLLNNTSMTIESVAHMSCMTRICGKWYMVEPQADEIRTIGVEL